MKGKIFWLVLLMFVAFLGGAFYFMGKSDDGWQWPQVSGCRTIPKQEVSNKVYSGDGFTFEYSENYILEYNTDFNKPFHRLWTPELYEVMSTATPECETCYWGGISIGYENDVDFELGSENETMENLDVITRGSSKVYGNRFNSKINPDYNYGYLITAAKSDGLIYYVQFGTKVVFFEIGGYIDLMSRENELRSLVETVKFTE